MEDIRKAVFFMMTKKIDKKRDQMMIQIPVIQYLYGIRSMRQTIREIEVNGLSTLF